MNYWRVWKMHKLQIKYKSQIEEMVKASVRLGELGYVASQGGNLSYRVEDDIIIITPTKIPKINLRLEDMVFINMQGKVLFAEEGRKPTGETPMHIHILGKRPDIRGLIHAHPPVLTGFSISGVDYLEKPLLPEAVIEVGPVISVRYEEPISGKLARAFDEVIDRSNAFLMKNHGVIMLSYESVGRALELLEMIEAMAASVVVAHQLGRVNLISPEEVSNLENTIRIRGLAMPGKPGAVKSLRDIFGV
jgi:ribulose-5-phosphate 4-epimerase/fuculose-1-phosphate aldolase